MHIPWSVVVTNDTPKHFMARVTLVCTWHAIRVGHNHIYRVHIYTVHILYVWQGNRQIYGHIRCIYTVLASSTCNQHVHSTGHKRHNSTVLALIHTPIVYGVRVTLIQYEHTFTIYNQMPISVLTCPPMCHIDAPNTPWYAWPSSTTTKRSRLSNRAKWECSGRMLQFRMAKWGKAKREAYGFVCWFCILCGSCKTFIRLPFNACRHVPGNQNF